MLDKFNDFYLESSFIMKERVKKVAKSLNLMFIVRL